MNKVRSDVSRRILIFLSVEFFLVSLLSIPLFLLKAESGSTLVMAASVIFMWVPALATFLTRKIANDKSELPLKPQIKKNWEMYFYRSFFIVCSKKKKAILTLMMRQMMFVRR